VAIRTLLANRRTGCAEYGVGSGITWDSDPEAEWQECRSKARILSAPVPAFRLLETMRWTPKEGYFLLERHLERLQDSARYFGVSLNLAALRRELEQLAARLGQARQKSPAAGHQGRALQPGGGSVAGVRGQAAARCGRPRAGGFFGPFLYHKTSNRGVYEAARIARPGFDDVLLFNEEGGITESTIANVAVEIEGKLCTPPVSCGLLPGILRAHLLQQGELIERAIAVEELLRSPRVFLLNSVRGRYAVEVLKAEQQ